MIRLARPFATILALTACAAAALAEDPHAPAGGAEPKAIQGMQEGLATAITALVVFFVVLIILAAKVWPVITKGLNERASKIREEIESAERARKQAKEALDQYQKSLAEARAEAQRMLEATKASQQALAAELKAKADAELNAMKDRARRDIEAAARTAIQEIYDEAGALATGMASKILRREVNAGDQKRLLEESMGELAAR